MGIIKKITPFLCVFSCLLLISPIVTAKGKISEEDYDYTEVESEGEGGEYEYEEEYESSKEYKRLYYTFGIGGHYFARKDGVDVEGTVGAYSSFDFRLSRVVSLGFDTYYGYLIGDGTAYWSSFNPGIKIFPMAYQNPYFEPYLFFGGHALDGVFGDSRRGSIGVAQGGFAGFGFRWYIQETMFGMEALVRASFLYMERPEPIGGRGLAIPILFIFGFVH